MILSLYVQFKKFFNKEKCFIFDQLDNKFKNFVKKI